MSAETMLAEAVQPQDRGAPVIRTIAMPSDTNPAGDIFGGWLMAQMIWRRATSPRAARAGAVPRSRWRR
jgi:acyl-CoA hydrolase